VSNPSPPDDQAKDEVGAIQAAMDQLIYRISHDLRAPLRQSRQLASWALEDWKSGDTEPVEEHLTMLDGRLAHMQGMLDALLELSRVTGHEADRSTVSLSAVLSDLLLDAPPPSHVSVEGPDPSIEAGGPSEALSRVLGLLIDNAVHHGGDELTSIEVKAVPSQPLLISVRDDGVGFEAQARRRGLDLFYTTRIGEGHVGAGLTLAAKIVTSMGGEIRAEECDGGALVTFTWPGPRLPSEVKP